MLDRLKNLDLTKMKSCAMDYVADATTHAKTIGAKAIKQAKYIGAKRMTVAGRSVNPFLLGAAALAIIGTTAYLLAKRNNKMRFAGMEEQDYPVK